MAAIHTFGVIAGFRPALGFVRRAGGATFGLSHHRNARVEPAARNHPRPSWAPRATRWSPTPAIDSTSPGKVRQAAVQQCPDTGLHRRRHQTVHSGPCGYGVAPVEPMACGVPVVASAVGALSDAVLPGVTRVLVQPRDFRPPARSLKGLLADETRRAQFGIAGRVRTRGHRLCGGGSATRRGDGVPRRRHLPRSSLARARRCRAWPCSGSRCAVITSGPAARS
ncbi:glycosyltransferase [Lentzea sp. NPDC060358]|uniref:glycosyltransferase n=1 Tax=Lentzea sp. NPDC060358 TaxID=3347103 RepID=UPI00364E3901